MLREAKPRGGRLAILLHSLWDGSRWAWRVVRVRLRFFFVLLAGFLIVGQWSVLRNYWDTLTMARAKRPALGGVSGEIEYFCPMCPGVVSVWPTNCSVCNMPLVRRKRGDAVQLPDGVLARMQLSPYRVHLAGIQTARVDYQPLAREILARGTVVRGSGLDQESGQAPNAADEDSASDSHTSVGKGSSDGMSSIAAEIDQRDLRLVAPGMSAVVAADIELPGEPADGRVSRIVPEVAPDTRRVKIEIVLNEARPDFWPGMPVNVHLRRLVAELEPFCSQADDPPALVEGEPRTLYTCLEHPHVLRDRRERCPEDDHLLMDRPLTDLERVGWWCPMHPEVTTNERGHVCEECHGMKLVPRIVRYRPAGAVLAVPDTAIVDLGDRRVAYVERMPGMFDAVEVVVGPRAGSYYPVVRGLEPGQRVAAAGAFLLDAETRLNPSVAASYFGASLASSSPHGESGTPHQHESTETAEVRAELDKLPAEERASVMRQKVCPVTGMLLGSMGAPVKIDLSGRPVWLCCEGCAAVATEDTAKTLAKLPPLSKP
ncbi:MAG TPA: heavy metal-binding domain-containing protein [Pirellulales bacterium]|nr:heavy metal-binding domain-containing protein [Pirellulales bacterium]